MTSQRFILTILLHFQVAVWRSWWQGRNHVFKVGGPIPWSRALLPFYRKKLDRSTRFGTVGYIITLYSSRSYVKSWGSSKFWGNPDHPIPSGCAHGWQRRWSDQRSFSTPAPVISRWGLTSGAGHLSRSNQPSAPSLTTFRHKLKTHLFRQSQPDIVL